MTIAGGMTENTLHAQGNFSCSNGKQVCDGFKEHTKQGKCHISLL
jgi:hypothetical protein